MPMPLYGSFSAVGTNRRNRSQTRYILSELLEHTWSEFRDKSRDIYKENSVVQPEDHR